MSAYLVSKQTIDAIVALCATERKHKGNPLTRDQMCRLGGMLILANRASVEARYRELPSNDVVAYTFDRVATKLDPVAALSVIQCYEYQACETDDFETSEAGLLCHYLKLWLLARFFPGYEGKISDLPGYDAAPWGL